MNQLGNSGLLLIKKDHVSDSIASYDVRLKVIYASEILYLSASNDTAYYDADTGFKNKILPFFEDNASSLPRFFNKMDFEIGATQNYIYNIQKVLPYAERLIAYLNKEYDLE